MKRYLTSVALSVFLLGCEHSNDNDAEITMEHYRLTQEYKAVSLQSNDLMQLECDSVVSVDIDLNSIDLTIADTVLINAWVTQGEFPTSETKPNIIYKLNSNSLSGLNSISFSVNCFEYNGNYLFIKTTAANTL